MHAVTIVNGNLEWSEHPDPHPGDTEVAVSVAAAGINNADLMQRKGHYPAPAGSPQDIPGMEFAGTVAEVGKHANRFALGDRVMAIAGGGAQAEVVVVPESVLLPVPDGIPWDEAGGFPEAFFTAYDALFTQGHLDAGQTVLISGAAGGVGTAAVQLAHAAGAHVVASVRSTERQSEVRELGADVVVHPDEVADHGPYDVSLELVGAAGVAAVLPLVATGARIVVIGVGAGAKLDLNLLAVMASRATIGGSTLRARTADEKAAVARAVEQDVLPLLARGTVRVHVSEVIPMEEASRGYERFATVGKFGKIVLMSG
jgi:putative PIG3 family NAD(P)H quinone oxidoreductase